MKMIVLADGRGFKETDRQERSYFNLDYCLSLTPGTRGFGAGLGLKGLTGVDEDEDLPGCNRFQIHLEIQISTTVDTAIYSIQLQISIRSPECAKVSADHGAGVEDEGGGVEA